MNEVADYAREHTTEALDALIAIGADSDQPATARIQAWREVLSRGWGQPRQSVDVMSRVDLSHLSDKELDILESLARRAAGAAGPGADSGRAKATRARTAH